MKEYLIKIINHYGIEQQQRKFQEERTGAFGGMRVYYIHDIRIDNKKFLVQ